jgi:methionyl-tRNA formyltransferase
VLEVSPAGILVACGDGALRVTELQRAGGKRLAAADFLHGQRIDPGERLG